MPQDYALELNRARVTPAGRPFDNGIATSGGKTQPFVVERDWAGPAGHYYEQWSIRQGTDVLFRGPLQTIQVRGIQSISTYRDTVSTPVELEAGTYKLVFVVEGRFMGDADVEVVAQSQAVA